MGGAQGRGSRSPELQGWRSCLTQRISICFSYLAALSSNLSGRRVTGQGGDDGDITLTQALGKQNHSEAAGSKMESQ